MTLWMSCKVDDAEVINFLLQTEIIPLCLRIMEAGADDAPHTRKT